MARDGFSRRTKSTGGWCTRPVSGRTVVRLKAGDPAVFARAAEEVAALVSAEVPFEIVPGITAALAAGSHAGISLTHRDLASAVAFVTGQEQDGKPSEAIDYAALARFPGTLVFYMGVTSAASWAAALVAGGKPADTPVAVVRRCSWPDQQTLRGTLGTLAELVAQHHSRPPAIVIVGDVVAWDEKASWFTARPLWGCRVLVTRPAAQAAEARDLLEEFGAQVLVRPAIEIRPPLDWSPIDEAIARLAQYDWLVFSSANGVAHFLDRLEATGGDLRRLGSIQLAAIGPGTAEALARYRLRADLVPREYRAEALAERAAGQRRESFAAGACQPRPRGAGRATGGRRCRGRSSGRLSKRRRRASRSGNGSGFGRGADRLDHGHQFGHCPLAGEAVWPAVGACPAS